MSRVLSDTHAIIWFPAKSDQVIDRAFDALEAAIRSDERIFISVIKIFFLLIAGLLCCNLFYTWVNRCLVCFVHDITYKLYPHGASCKNSELPFNALSFFISIIPGAGRAINKYFIEKVI